MRVMRVILKFLVIATAISYYKNYKYYKIKS